LSIRTSERDLDEEFSRFGRVEKVTIVYDQRVRLTLYPVMDPLSDSTPVRQVSWLWFYPYEHRRGSHEVHN
jgi:hypothetical protein